MAADEGNGNDNDKDNDNKAAPPAAAAAAAVEAEAAAAMMMMMMAIENLFSGYSLQGFSWNFQGVEQQLNYEKRLFENC